jgi:hypothetical protein
MEDFKKDSLIENYNRIVRAKNNRLNEAGMFFGQGFIKENKVSGDGFEAIDRGVISGYEEDSKLEGDGFHEWDVTLSRPLNLGNNYTDDHFAEALKDAYGDSELLDNFLETEVSLSDTINFIYRGNYGKHKDTWGMSDLSDFLR